MKKKADPSTLKLSKETLAHLKVQSSMKTGVAYSNGEGRCTASNQIKCII